VAVLGLLVSSARTLLAQQQVVAGAQEVAVVDQGLWVSWQAEGAGHTESNGVRPCFLPQQGSFSLWSRGLEPLG
jgi:hypothetical protein